MSEFEKHVESLMCAPSKGGLPIKEARQLASKFGVAPRSSSGTLRTREELADAMLYGCGGSHDQKGGMRRGKGNNKKAKGKKNSQAEGKLVLEEPMSRSMILGPLIKALPSLRKKAQSDTGAKIFVEWREDPEFSRSDPAASGHLYFASLDSKAVDATRALLVKQLDDLMKAQAERMEKTKQRKQNKKMQKKAPKSVAAKKSAPMTAAKQVRQLVSREPSEEEIIVLEMILESLGEPEYGDEVQVGESTFQWSPEGWEVISA